MDEIRRRNLNTLNPQRAARFIVKHLPAKGARVSTADLHLTTDEDLLDLLAALSFDREPGANSRHPVRWRVLAERADLGLEPGRIPRDPEAGRLVERLILERTS